MVFIKFNDNLHFTNTLNLHNYIENKFNINDYFIIFKGKNITNNYYSQHIDNNDTIEILLKIKGGGILDILKPVFEPIIKPIINIAKAVIKLTELLLEIVKLFINLIKMIPEILSPDKLINGIIFGTLEGIKGLFTGTIGQLGGGSPRREKPKKKKKGYCFKATLFKLIILVLCPPLAIFVDRGLKGIIPIIISGALTYYLYYFPGLIFASLYLLN